MAECPNCGAPEVAATTPRTTYACGSSDYDQRPGTFERHCAGQRLSERIALIDMDGTLFDYDGAMRRDMLTLCAPGEQPRWDDEAPAYMRQRKRLIQRQPGWWRSLVPIELGFAIVAELRKRGYRIVGLTKGPGSHNAGAWSEKVECWRLHLPGDQITVTEDKGLTYGKILVDDWPEYALRWLEWRRRGLVLMPSQPWNEGFQHPQVLRVDPSPESFALLRDRLVIFDALEQP